MKEKIFSAVFAITFFCATVAGNFSQKVFAEENGEVEFQAVSYTAPITLHWLAKAGVPEAVEFLGTLSADDILKKVSLRDPERVEKANSIYQEIHYTALNNYIESNGYKNVMDLGCGVSPRGIVMARKGIHYVGVELPAVTEAMEEYAPMFLEDDELNYFHIATADFTDHDAMMAAAKNIQGPVCIVSELVMVFLSREKQDALLKNVHEILKEHGGCFVTADYTTGELFYDGTETIYGQDATWKISQETVRLYASISETNFTGTIFDTHKEAIDFIKAHNFNVEEVPILPDSSNLYSIRSLNDRQINKIKKFTKRKLLWVMTAK